MSGEIIKRPRAIEPTEIDKVTPEEKWGTSPIEGVWPILQAYDAKMEGYNVLNERWREGFMADPSTCNHTRQRWSPNRGEWYCRDCGSQL